jgi:hypothetical protein
MKKTFLAIAIASLLISCDKATEPTPNPGNNTSNGSSGTNTTTNDATLAELPEGLPKSTDCILADMELTLSGAASDKQGYKFSYDKYNRIVKSEATSTLFPNVTTYTYEKGKVKIVGDAVLTGGIKVLTEINYVLDEKNRVSESTYFAKTTASGQIATSVKKSTYKYDANGYLEEVKSEDDMKVTQTQKYTWEGGNLIKTEVLNYVDTKTKYDKYLAYTTYDFDKTKSNNSWDVNSVTGSALAAGIAYFGKTNKNVITKVSNIQDWSISNPIAISTLFSVVSDYKYTYNSKGYVDNFEINTVTKVGGSFPVGVPDTRVVGKANFKCN